MDATLVTVTVLSMGMAAALSAIVWRMLRLERQRSNARVAALRQAAGQASRRGAGQALRPEVGQALRPEVGQALSLEASPRVDNDLPIRSTNPGNAAAAIAPAMFVEREHASPWRPRLAVMAALVLIVASIVLFSLALQGRRTSHAAAAKAAPVSATAPDASAGGLELLSLRDARQTGTLTITGLVQNPRTGAPLSHVAVTVYTFDAGGSFLASGRALIDVTSLAPGEESPFTVSVPAGDNVARYRIGFRDETGRVIGHVDRRQQGPLASN